MKKKSSKWEVWKAYVPVECGYAVYQKGIVRSFCYAPTKEIAQKIANDLNKLSKLEDNRKRK